MVEALSRSREAGEAQTVSRRSATKQGGNMSLEEAKFLVTLAGFILALVTLLKGILEYSRQGAQKRAEHFLEMRKRLKENKLFKEICALLEGDSPQLREVPFKEKRDLLGFFEEVALMVNSGLIRKEVAHYMFGYYAIRCWESDHFWNDVNRGSIYWRVFKEFDRKYLNGSLAKFKRVLVP